MKRMPNAPPTFYTCTLYAVVQQARQNSAASLLACKGFHYVQRLAGGQALVWPPHQKTLKKCSRLHRSRNM